MSGIPEPTLRCIRDSLTRTLPDRCVLLEPTYYPDSGLYNPPYQVALSGVPTPYRPRGFTGSGVPVDIWDIITEPDLNLMQFADSLRIGYQQYRYITLPWFVPLALSGFREGCQVVTGGYASGPAWLGGNVYEVAALDVDTSQLGDLVVHARKVTEGRQP